MQPESNQRYIIVATLAFIIGFGLSWLITANKDNTSEKVTQKEDEIAEQEELENGEENSVVEETTNSGVNTVSVLNQEAGSFVKVNNVTLDTLSWVVVHEDNGSGAPGRILGAQLFDPGKWDGSVELLRNTMPGQTYYAMLHADNNDRAFDPKKDMPLKDSEGNIVMVSFQTEGATE